MFCYLAVTIYTALSIRLRIWFAPTFILFSWTLSFTTPKWQVGKSTSTLRGSISCSSGYPGEQGDEIFSRHSSKPESLRDLSLRGAGKSTPITFWAKNGSARTRVDPRSERGSVLARPLSPRSDKGQGGRAEKIGIFSPFGSVTFLTDFTVCQIPWPNELPNYTFGCGRPCLLLARILSILPVRLLSLPNTML